MCAAIAFVNETSAAIASAIESIVVARANFYTVSVDENANVLPEALCVLCLPSGERGPLKERRRADSGNRRPVLSSRRLPTRLPRGP